MLNVESRRLDPSLSAQQIARPLVTPQEDGTAHTDPPHSGPYASEERSRPVLPQYCTQHGEHGLFLLGQHHARLQHIKRRRHTRGDRTSRRAQQPTFQTADLASARLRLPPALQRLPQRELDHSEGHLADNRDAPPAVQLPPHMRQAVRRALVQNVRQRAQAARVLARLRALLDHLGRHAHRTCGDLAQTRRQHVCCCAVAARHRVLFAFGVAQRGGARRKVALHGVIGYEEEGGAGRGSHDCAAYAAVDACEASGGSEAARGL